MSKLEFRKLRADEIDCRISMCSEYGVGLLLYKDARCDQNILDETVGPTNWQRHHSRDNANCIVSIWDEEKKQWIEKEDTGTESYTEKEKGLASDSFKRACFNWGIGRELYTAPSMYVKAKDLETLKKDGSRWVCKDTFKVTHIEYEGDKICYVRVENQRKKSFMDFGTPLAISKITTSKIDETKVKSLESRCVNDGVNIDKILNHFQVKYLKDLTEKQLSIINQFWDKFKEA
jgi:hypothetical protein